MLSNIFNFKVGNENSLTRWYTKYFIKLVKPENLNKMESIKTIYFHLEP